MKGKRTGIDFSKHELKITETEGLLVHHLKKAGTSCDNIRFINTNGILAVTGDYGNWIFCREFHPAADADGACDYYWTQKLKIASTQQPYEWDEEGTRRDLLKEIEELKADKKANARGIKYYQDCLRNMCGSKEQYTQFAYENLPDHWDYESIICRDRLKYWLQAVYDGFDEICRRMKAGELTVGKPEEGCAPAPQRFTEN